MDSRFLESLLAVIEGGSIVAAARAQALTPAAVSQRIQVLERQLGITLLQRQANSAAATIACLDLLPEIDRIVTLSRDLKRRADTSAAAGVLRLGAISTMLTGLLPRLLKDLQQAAPDIELRIEPGSSAALYEAVAADRLDAALIVAPPFEPPRQIVLHLLRREPLMLLAPAGHQQEPPAALFARFPHIAYDSRSWGGKIADRYLRDHGITARLLCELDGLEAISDLVESGIGVSLVPDWPGLSRAVPLVDGNLYQRDIALALPRGSQRPAGQRVLLECLKLQAVEGRP